MPTEQAFVRPPADFLENAAKQLKARWRQHYRPSPPTPSPNRMHVAFAIGTMVADNYLAFQARDAQQFRNNSQDLLNYCRVLGIAEKLSPYVMSGSKMAETEDWPALRSKIFETQEHIVALLMEQRDDDPSKLVTLGLWFRLLDITASLAADDTELKDKMVTIGDLGVIESLVTHYKSLTEATRADEDLALAGNALELLQRHWTGQANQPTQELVELTRTKLKFVITKVTDK
ncbi:MAG: hypothetical protein ACOYMN_12675 [Roseimicrobium sp.]